MPSKHSSGEILRQTSMRLSLLILMNTLGTSFICVIEYTIHCFITFFGVFFVIKANHLLCSTVLLIRIPNQIIIINHGMLDLNLFLIECRHIATSCEMKDLSPVMITVLCLRWSCGRACVIGHTHSVYLWKNIDAACTLTHGWLEQGLLSCFRVNYFWTTWSVSF